jgi:hypothetical protein
VNRKFLGDSFDAVKRLWQSVLAGWAPLYAEPRFVPADVRREFTRLTLIPMLMSVPPAPYSILNDPDTGIRLPGEDNQAEGRGHISLPTICNQISSGGARVVVTFDMSNYRQSRCCLASQRRSKLSCLRDAGISGFYYVSHAPFLFACPDQQVVKSLQDRLLEFGIPIERFEELTPQRP